jgi:hypothetical protein
MSLPARPIPTILQNGFRLQRMLDPISTDMEDGNTRERPRPSDSAGTITQTVRMYPADYDAFVAWVRTTLNNWHGPLYHGCLAWTVAGEQGLPIHQAGARM